MSFVKDSLYGFVIGDALGVPVEFEERKKLMSSPVTTMKGYGSYDVPEGTCSDLFCRGVFNLSYSYK